MSGFRFNLTPRDVPKVNTKHRTIRTQIPVPESLTVFDKLDRYESTAMHGQMPVVWDRASDFQVFDAWGNCWIDFTSTIFVTNAGHANPRILRAMRQVADKPLLHTYTYASRERADYLEYLIANTPRQFEKAFFLSAGTEATECALKLMRERGALCDTRKKGVVCFEGNWHGRTLGAQMMGWNPAQKEWIGYLDPGIHHLAFPYPWRQEAMEDPAGYFERSMEALLQEKELDPDRDLCGFMLETFQGWGAVFYPPAFVQAVERFAREHGMLMAFDEMQSGFGRTGKLFGYQHYGVEPDILCCGKGAGSGVPLSIVLASSEIMDTFPIGSMSSTHSANPLVCAVGKANLEALLEDGLIESGARLGDLFHQKLDALHGRFPEQIGWIQGKGLVASVIFTTRKGAVLPHLCDRICELGMERGLLMVHTGRESIKLAPPLSISEEAMLEGLDVFEECTAQAVKELC
ncbi:MAG: aspartate aminotransferase family protein [Desulfovibrionaceae bacterium]